MVKRILDSKKGQSLVEVVVALGVIAIVFSGTVNLIVRVVGLNLDARDVTQATALAQKALTEAVSNTASNCTAGVTTVPATNVNLGGKNFTYQVASSAYDISTAGVVTSNASGAFLKVTATVSWNDREGDPRSNVVEQYIRRNQ